MHVNMTRIGTTNLLILLFFFIMEDFTNQMGMAMTFGIIQNRKTE